MLNFLTPPTDSFYKFLAISGLILFISSIYLISFNDPLYSGEHDKLLGEKKYLKKEVEILKSQLKLMF